MKKDLCNTSRIGRYGRMRLEFIKQERQELYTQLLFSAGLEEYLIDINDRVKERIWELTQQIAQKQSITEKLKVHDQMAWVGAMNAIRAQTEEIVKRNDIRINVRGEPTRVSALFFMEYRSFRIMGRTQIRMV